MSTYTFTYGGPDSGLGFIQTELQKNFSSIQTVTLTSNVVTMTFTDGISTQDQTSVQSTLDNLYQESLGNNNQNNSIFVSAGYVTSKSGVRITVGSFLFTPNEIYKKVRIYAVTQASTCTFSLRICDVISNTSVCLQNLTSTNGTVLENIDITTMPPITTVLEVQVYSVVPVNVKNIQFN